MLEGIFETTGMTVVVLGKWVTCLVVCLVLIGVFLVGIGLSFIGVVGPLFDKDVDTFNWCLLEITVGGTGEFKKFVGTFFPVASDGGLEGEGLERDPFGIVGLVAIDFAVVGLEVFTSAGLETICFEVVGFDIVVGFTLTGFDALLRFEFECFTTVVGFELLSFDELLGFDLIVCFVPLDFETLIGFETAGFGLANIVSNGLTVTV